MTAPLALDQRIKSSPRRYDEDAALRFMEKSRSVLSSLSPAAQDLAGAVASCSPYLGRVMMRDPDRVAAIMGAPPEDFMAVALAATKAAGELQGADEQASALRRLKDDAALVTGLAEISGAWTTLEAAAHWTAFADAAVEAGFTMALRRLLGPEAQTSGSGLVALAMGKQGGFELNYSSDIDLIVLFDSEQNNLGDEAQKTAIAATKIMVSRLSDQTKDGYVFRTDLRLRPDPGVSAAAISFNAAEAYYESYGQNWERAAFIKARACAGDVQAGQSFLQRLRPFVWRKHLDYAAIEDIHSIKRQIHAAKGGGAIEFMGHDLKTGRGGIREIEFLAQTQQLILGGKDPDLRSRSTVETLKLLAEREQISVVACEELTADYAYLRKVEHRIQMIADEQTHKIPTSDAGVERLWKFLGEAGLEQFEEKIRAALTRVHGHFSELFDREEALSGGEGSLSFTGVEADPATLKTLSAYGFSTPDTIDRAIRRWHSGALRSTRTTRSRELLTKLTPQLLQALARADQPDEAFLAFDQFLQRLPAGVQIFSLLYNNPAIYDALIRIMTISPVLGRSLSRHGHLIEAVLENDLAASPIDSLATSLAIAVERASGFEGQLNAMRRWKAEENFRTSVHLVTGELPVMEAAHSFSKIAETVIVALDPLVRAETERLYGEIDGALSIVALGRLGAGVMTAASDVDLIFIYDAAEDAVSTGAKSLGAVDYFTRLVRRFVTAMTVSMEEGVLFEVDMQLRPSGRAGPAAVKLPAFERYYDEEAWTWEKMALVKGRAIAGDAALGARIEAKIAAILKEPRDRAKTARDVREMRSRLTAAKPAHSIWDVKNALGGMTDIDFIIQYLALAGGADHGSAQNRVPPSPRATLQYLNKNAMIDDETLLKLLTAAELFETILQISRAASDGVFSPNTAGEALRDRMAAACGDHSIEEVEVRLGHAFNEIHALFLHYLGPDGGAGDSPPPSPKD